MAIGAVDQIDQLLVQKYSTTKVDNHDNTISMISPKKMLTDMNEFSSYNKNFITLNQKLSATCSALNSLNAKYTSSSIF